MPSDSEFLGLSPTDDHGGFRFTVQNHLARMDRHLYGGTAIAVSITASEIVTERSALWMTTQFVSTAPPEEEITVSTEVLAGGHRTSQVRVTGTNPSGAVMFASLGATGHHRDGGLAGIFEHAPVVDGPEDGVPWATPFTGMARHLRFDGELPPPPTDVGFVSVMELREPTVHEHPDPGPGRLCVWVRRRDRQPVTPAMAAYMADMVPLSLSAACGTMALGISLDNSIRIGAFEETEWVLIDLRPHLAVGDYGHGVAHIWSRNGRLLATASQSAALRRIDVEGFRQRFGRER